MNGCCLDTVAVVGATDHDHHSSSYEKIRRRDGPSGPFLFVQSQTPVLGSRFSDPGSRIPVLGSRFSDPGSRFSAPGPRYFRRRKLQAKVTCESYRRKLHAKVTDESCIIIQMGTDPEGSAKVTHKIV